MKFKVANQLIKDLIALHQTYSDETLNDKITQYINVKNLFITKSLFGADKILGKSDPSKFTAFSTDDQIAYVLQTRATEYLHQSTQGNRKNSINNNKLTSHYFCLILSFLLQTDKEIKDTLYDQLLTLETTNKNIDKHLNLITTTGFYTKSIKVKPLDVSFSNKDVFISTESDSDRNKNCDDLEHFEFDLVDDLLEIPDERETQLLQEYEKTQNIQEIKGRINKATDLTKQLNAIEKENKPIKSLRDNVAILLTDSEKTLESLLQTLKDSIKDYYSVKNQNYCRHTTPDELQKLDQDFTHFIDLLEFQSQHNLKINDKIPKYKSAQERIQNDLLELAKQEVLEKIKMNYLNICFPRLCGRRHVDRANHIKKSVWKANRIEDISGVITNQLSLFNGKDSSIRTNLSERYGKVGNLVNKKQARYFDVMKDCDTIMKKYAVG